MLSIVIPCYNEEKNIETLVERFSRIKEKLDLNGFELILVDNGSQDKTREKIIQKVNTNDYIKMVSVDLNQGYGYGILQGFKVCGGEWIGWIHADLQLPPEAFCEMIETIKSSYNNDKLFFKGRRENRPFSDTIFTIGMGCFESIYLGKRLWDINAQPTLINKNLLEKIKTPPFDFSLDLYIYYMARKYNYDIRRVRVVQQPRIEGESSWNNGIKARMRLIMRTLKFSRQLKRNIGGERIEKEN